MITTESSADAGRRLESKLYKHAWATRNLTAKHHMQKRAVEASTLFFWTCFFLPAGQAKLRRIERGETLGGCETPWQEFRFGRKRARNVGAAIGAEQERAR